MEVYQPVHVHSLGHTDNNVTNQYDRFATVINSDDRGIDSPSSPPSCPDGSPLCNYSGARLKFEMAATFWGSSWRVCVCQ